MEGRSLLLMRVLFLLRNIDNSLIVYLFLEFKPQLGKSEKFNNQAMKENRTFRILFIVKKQTGFAWNFIRRYLDPLFQGNFFLMFPLFQKNLNPPSQNQQNGKQCCMPPFSFKISLKDTSFHISLSCLWLYLFPKCLLDFL